ncbi:MAG: HK97 family phage prohead protease [Pseudomonadota bacterium]
MTAMPKLQPEMLAETANDAALQRGAQTEALERKFMRAAISSVEADGTFEGYASLFGMEDLGGDIVALGAFRQSLAARGIDGVRLLFQHDPLHPIGIWIELREDRRGLYVKGRLLTDVSKGAEALSLMRAGALTGLSIGFHTNESRTDPVTGVRTLLEVDLWEISVVTFPMLPGARISAVKSGNTHSRRGARLPSERVFERWLMQDAGLTRTEARLVLKSGYRALRNRNGPTQDARALSAPQTKALINSLRRGTRSMTPRQKT